MLDVLACNSLTISYSRELTAKLIQVIHCVHVSEYDVGVSPCTHPSYLSGSRFESLVLRVIEKSKLLKSQDNTAASLEERHIHLQ